MSQTYEVELLGHCRIEWDDPARCGADCRHRDIIQSVAWCRLFNHALIGGYRAKPCTDMQVTATVYRRER